MTDPAQDLPGLDRRTVLRTGAALGVGTIVVSAAACDRGPTPAQITAEALLPLADAALVDEGSARALAPRYPDYTKALGVIADQRGQHARALREEITRLDREIAGRIVTLATTSGSPSPTPATSAAPPSSTGPTTIAANLDDLRAALRISARTAADTAIRLQGYSAGLSGSVSASVTTMTTVQLR